MYFKILLIAYDIISFKKYFHKNFMFIKNNLFANIPQMLLFCFIWAAIKYKFKNQLETFVYAKTAQLISSSIYKICRLIILYFWCKSFCCELWWESRVIQNLLRRRLSRILGTNIVLARAQCLSPSLLLKTDWCVFLQIICQSRYRGANARSRSSNGTSKLHCTNENILTSISLTLSATNIYEMYVCVF